MPVRDGFFPDTPAEQHRDALALGREVDQAGVEILDLDAELLEPLDAGDADNLLLRSGLLGQDQVDGSQPKDGAQGGSRTHPTERSV